MWSDITKDLQINCKFNVWVNIGDVKTGFSGAIAGSAIFGGINFKDKAFKKSLYKALNKNDYYIMRREEAKNIKYLNLARQGFSKEDYINSIEDLKYFPDLISLSLKGNNKLSDIEFLKDLTNIKKLEIAYNIITDLSPISLMTGLEGLDISENKVQNRSLRDIKVLELCNNLKVLRCAENEDIPEEQFDSIKKVNPNLKIDKQIVSEW